MTTPKSTSNSKAPATKKGGSHSKKGSGAMEAAPTRRSSRGSGTGGKGKDAVEEEKEEEKGDRGNIFDRMKTWKKNQEHKEEKKWEEAIVDLEEKIENGEADDSLTVEAEEALHEVAKEEEEAVAAAAAAEEEEDEDDEEMSSYEKERLANIKRNNAFLLNLGIDTVAVPVTPKVCECRCKDYA